MKNVTVTMSEAPFASATRRAMSSEVPLAAIR